MKANTQFARILGNLACAKGIQSAPALDQNFMATLAGREVGDKRTIPELKAWISGWHEANLAGRYAATTALAS